MAAPEGKLNLKHSMSVQEIAERVQHAILLPTIDRAIVAIGVTGAGKSTLLNILAGKDAFEAAGGPEGCTKKVQKEIVHFQSSTFALIDTPGLLDPETVGSAIDQGEKTHVVLTQQFRRFAAYMEEALHEAGERVDAFLLVFNAESRWSVEAEWVVDILNTIGLAYRHIIVVFTHGDGLGKTKAERCAEMEKRLNHRNADVYGLKDLFNKLQQGRREHQQCGGTPATSVEYPWMITESNDFKSSGNSGIWTELLEKQKNVVAMCNEDFIAIRSKLEDEEETRRWKHATLEEIAQLQTDIQDIEMLKSKIKELEPNILHLRQLLDERVMALKADYPELQLAADTDLSAYHGNLLCACQEKRDQLNTLKEEYAILKDQVDRKTTVEATTSRNDHAQANKTALEKAEEYWPQYMNGAEADMQDLEAEENNDASTDNEETDQLLS